MQGRQSSSLAAAGKISSFQMFSTETATGSSSAIAPAWHTALVLFALLGVSLLGALSGNRFGITAHGRSGSYLFIMVFEWVMVAFIWYGVSRRGIRISELVAGRWQRPRDFFLDLALALAFIAVYGIGMVNGLGYLLKAAPSPAFRNLLPQSPTEIALYLILSLTAGFCEELIFRGYLLRQFSALTRSTAGGIVLQGIAFGAGHGYQGLKFMLLIAVYGVTFGLLAHWRRTLRPGMIAHFVQDGLGGIVARQMLR
jgi:uncharacterized protein